MRSFPARYQGDLFDALARLRPPLILTILLLLCGTMGFMAIDGFPFVDALYMTVISVATVGFGEIHPLSPGGRIFTMALIMSGFAVFTYSVGVFVEVITRRDFFGLIRIQSMESKIKQLRDHYIIVGYTPIAQELARVFKRRNMPFVVVENEAKQLRKVKEDHIEYFMQANFYDNETYKKAAVEEARGLITTFKNDSDNITVVVAGRIVEEATGRDLFIVSTCSDEQAKARLERVGADYVISPDSLIGNRISALALRPPTDEYESILERVAFGEYTDLDIREVPIKPDTPIVGLSIRENDLRRKTGAYIVAIKREGRKVRINPPPDEVVRNGDTIMLIGTPKQLNRVAIFLTPERTEVAGEAVT
ncbi:MAG: potassium channel family protein [Leptospirillia bacterium]